MIREPAVAGSFYPSNQHQLVEIIEKCFKDSKIGPGELPNKSKQFSRIGKIYGLISPHAGYVYSGPVAAHGFLKQFQDGKPDFFVIIGPNHWNIGPPISVFPGKGWKTPLGEAKIPSEIVEIITKQPHFRADSAAHMREHSIEIQVPFLQYLYGGDVPIIPICIKEQSKLTCERISSVLPKVLADYDYCMIASTDLTHFETSSRASEKDQFVIQAIKKMDPEGLLSVVEEKYITMCGPGPVSSVLMAAKSLGYKDVEILKYANSGDVSGDTNRVVAYLSAIIYK